MPSCGRRQRRPCGNARRFSRAAEATAPSRGALNSSLLAADLSGVSRLVLGQGLRDTRTALVRWNGKPGPIVRAWLGWSVAVASALLAAVYAIAVFSPPDPTPLAVPGVTHASVTSYAAMGGGGGSNGLLPEGRPFAIAPRPIACRTVVPGHPPARPAVHGLAAGA